MRDEKALVGAVGVRYPEVPLSRRRRAEDDAAVRCPRRMSATGGARYARRARAVRVHHPDVHDAVPIGVERDALSVRGPGGVPRERGTRRTRWVRQPALIGTIGANGVQVPDAIAIRVEDDTRAIGRPGGMRVVGAGEGEPPLTGAVCIYDVKGAPVVSVALVHELASVGRP